MKKDIKCSIKFCKTVFTGFTGFPQRRTSSLIRFHKLLAWYRPKMGSKAMQFCEVFSPWTEKSPWTCIHVLLACVLTSVVWNGVELTGVDESLSFSCPVPVLSPERLAVAQELLTPSASKSHYVVILEASHQLSANQRGPPLWDHTCQLCSQSHETNRKCSNSK